MESNREMKQFEFFCKTDTKNQANRLRATNFAIAKLEER